MTSFFQRLFGTKPQEELPRVRPLETTSVTKEQTMPKLYDFELSGSCCKVHLLASFLGLELDKQFVDS